MLNPKFHVVLWHYGEIPYVHHVLLRTLWPRRRGYAYGLCASGFGADLVVEADLGALPEGILLGESYIWVN